MEQLSLRSKTCAAGTGPGAWYESDIFGGVDFVFGKFTVGTVYTFYTYPNGAFDTIQEIGFKVGYDDTEFMKDKASASPSSRTSPSTSRRTTATAARTGTAKSGIAPGVYTFNKDGGVPGRRQRAGRSSA